MPALPRLTDLRCEHLINPLGLDEPAPRFSWTLADARTGAAQTAYQLEVSSGSTVIWDSGRVDSDTSVLVPHAGPALHPHTRYHWRVRIWDHVGSALAWSNAAWFETGFLEAKAPWPSVQWIRSPFPEKKGLRPIVQFRKTFRLDAAPAKPASTSPPAACSNRRSTASASAATTSRPAGPTTATVSNT